VGLVNSSVGGQCANAWYGDFASVGLLAVYSAATAAVSPGAGMLGAGLLRSTKLLPPRPGRSSQVRQPRFLAFCLRYIARVPRSSATLRKTAAVQRAWWAAARPAIRAVDGNGSLLLGNAASGLLYWFPQAGRPASVGSI